MVVEIMSDIQQKWASQLVHPFDARGIGKRFRHAAIFGALASLQAGEIMRFVNDHDPLPLLEQIERYFGDRVQVSYRRRDVGEVVIDFLIAY